MPANVRTMAPPTLQDLWAQTKFEPNPTQRKAIEQTSGPVFLTAGPGSGKTRVLLWRTVNLIVFGSVSPSAIFLSTFTEKAARQLKQGLQVYVGLASNLTGRTFDLSQIYVGTLHSLCQRILADRRLSADGKRTDIPILLDRLDQYFFLHEKRNCNTIIGAADLKVTEVNQIFGNVYRNGEGSTSRHVAVQSLIAFFNRLSEESVNEVEAAKSLRDKALKKLLLAYGAYKQLLATAPEKTDLSLLQQAAFRTISKLPTELVPFEHVIVDEYQDTNAIQEKLLFALARRTSNLCVVGDDDQPFIVSVARP
jgi:ATP-dependent DNA helicase UvrD/PcrA